MDPESNLSPIVFENWCPFLFCTKSGPHEHEICPRCRCVISCDETKKYHDEKFCHLESK
jgi:hypothetical protein